MDSLPPHALEHIARMGANDDASGEADGNASGNASGNAGGDADVAVRLYASIKAARPCLADHSAVQWHVRRAQLLQQTVTALEHRLRKEVAVYPLHGAAVTDADTDAMYARYTHALWFNSPYRFDGHPVQFLVRFFMDTFWITVRRADAKYLEQGCTAFVDRMGGEKRLRLGRVPVQPGVIGIHKDRAALLRVFAEAVRAYNDTALPFGVRRSSRRHV